MNETSFFGLLPPKAIQKLVEASTCVSYSDKQLIHSRGQTKPGLSVVCSGTVQVGISDTNGLFVMTGILGPGESFGEFTLFAELPRTHDVIAFGETQVYQIPKNRFMPLYESEPEISKALLKSSLLRTHYLLEQLDALKRLPLLERTAKALVSMSQTTGDRQKVDCLQSDLAQSLGVTRISMGKVLKQLANLGLIELGYRKIIFPDMNLLEDWVTEHCNTTPLNWS
ncbi:Crp/Fnr family transcriptional regulator [Alteromonadaceae bacterium M269]|nr:Crp/Fnr family transcriptional regulator [Alteromonadaceae bacterium M269]